MLTGNGYKIRRWSGIFIPGHFFYNCPVRIYFAYIVYFKKPSLSEAYSFSRLNKFFEKGWGFDKLYDTIFVKPIVWLSVIDKMIF